jgi:hypothetical protein
VKLLVLAAAALVLLTSCDKGPEGPLVEGMSNLGMRRRTALDRKKPEYYIELGFDLVRTLPLVGGEHMWLRASCQVGDHRIYDESPMSIGTPTIDDRHFIFGARNRMEETPYLINPLRAAPGQCDFALLLGDYAGDKPDQELSRYCVGDKTTPGPCPPNPAVPPASGPPITVDQLEVSISPASPPFPEALLLEYLITAQADMHPKAKAHLVVQCAGGIDDVYHQEVEKLVAGESIQEGQLKFQGRIPDTTVPCDIRYYLVDDFDSRGELFASFCYVMGQVSRGECDAGGR